jgi:hypothetical protein
MHERVTCALAQANETRRRVQVEADDDTQKGQDASFEEAHQLGKLKDLLVKRAQLQAVRHRTNEHRVAARENRFLIRDCVGRVRSSRLGVTSMFIGLGQRHASDRR